LISLSPQRWGTRRLPIAASSLAHTRLTATRTTLAPAFAASRAREIASLFVRTHGAAKFREALPRGAAALACREPRPLLAFGWATGTADAPPLRVFDDPLLFDEQLAQAASLFLEEHVEVRTTVRRRWGGVAEVARREVRSEGGGAAAVSRWCRGAEVMQGRGGAEARSRRAPARACSLSRLSRSLLRALLSLAMLARGSMSCLLRDERRGSLLRSRLSLVSHSRISRQGVSQQPT
jgi:hypothetical protein